MENSVAVTSVSQPGIVFGLNDSGNQPLLFAFDSTGVGRGLWRIDRARNGDWEAAARGPCAPGSDVSCLYIGDVGDNEAARRYVSIYRLREPRVAPSMPGSPVRVPFDDRLDFRYPDRPHDVEAMYVAPDGSTFLITKRRLLDTNRRPRPALVFRIAAAAWDSSGVVMTALVDSLPIVPGQVQGGQITDAALSPDGRYLAVRTYAEVFTFAMDSATGRPRRDVAPSSCAILRLREQQGEGVGWWWDGRRLLLTSETRNAPMHVIECAKPGR